MTNKYRAVVNDLDFELSLVSGALEWTIFQDNKVDLITDDSILKDSGAGFDSSKNIPAADIVLRWMWNNKHGTFRVKITND